MIQLLKTGRYTAGNLSQIIGIREKDVYYHLEHVQKSIGTRKTIITEAAKCLTCGFEFSSRKRITPPGKCPKCRSEHVTLPIYRIDPE